MPERPTVPVAGVALLVAIIGAFAATIGFSVLRSSRETRLRDLSTRFERYVLLGTSLSKDGQAQADLPGFGHLNAPRFLPAEPSLLVWVEGPADQRRQGSAWLDFPGHEFLSVESHPASVPGVFCVSVPPYYPDDAREAELRILFNDSVQAKWKLNALPPSRRNWPAGSGQIEAQAGPAKVQGMVWREQEFGGRTLGSTVGVTVRASMTPSTGKQWQVEIEDVAAPFFGPKERRPEPAATSERFVNGQAYITTFARMPLKALQPSARIVGHIIQGEESDEVVEFHDLETVSQRYAPISYVVPGRHSSATTRSGVKVTLLAPPSRYELRPGSFWGTGLAIFYRLEPRKVAPGTRVTLLDPSGKLLLRMFDTPQDGMIVSYQARDFQGLAPLKLLVRTLKERQSFPFTLTVPIVERRTDGWPINAIAGPNAKGLSVRP